MKILVLNRGSSSLKSSIYELHSLPKIFLEPIWSAHLEWKNDFEGAHLTIESQGKKTEKKLKNGNGVEEVALLAKEEGIDAIGHRIVHGGKRYKKTILIDQSVKDEIKRLASLAPLHNLADLEGIEVFERVFKNKPQFAIFDTAFHHTLPLKASVYPGPYQWIEEGIVRYGFHGTSFQYCTRRATKILGQDSKLIICHLGSGASLCAVKEGKSIDTTMGFTPLEGLMMDTRSGTVDPGILLYLLKGKSVEEVSEILYKKSGLLGLSESSSDMRDIMELKTEKAKLALDVYLHRLTQQIGSMNVSLGGMEVLVFTAGIGENAPLVRKKTCETLSFLGVELDEEKNLGKGDRIISTKGSKIKILVIYTQESFEIARECWKLLEEGHAKFR